jgi:hypothetical protein
MARMVNYRSLKEQYDADPAHCVRELGEAIENGQLRVRDLSIRELAEATIGEGVVRAMERRKGGGLTLLEAASAVDTSAFSNITGQIIYSETKREYELADTATEALCTTVPTTILDGEKIPGVSGIGDEAEVVDEGQPFPTVGVSEEYIQTPPLKKRGFICPVTREIIIADKTGLVVKRCGDGARWMGLNKFKRVMDQVIGATNNYKRNGTALNTYLMSGAYINQQANPLVDWTDIENAELLFDAMTDPNTGEPIGAFLMGRPMTLVVPTALHRTARRIVNANEIRYGDGASGTTATYGQNPLNGTQIAILTSPYVKARTGSGSKWFFGSPKDAVVYMEAWGVETQQAPANSTADFERDIRLQFKVSEMGVPATVEPRYLTANT